MTEVVKVTLLDSYFEDHVYVVWEHKDGEIEGRNLTEDLIPEVKRSCPRAVWADNRKGHRPGDLPAESYGKIGTLRRGGRSVL